MSLLTDGQGVCYGSVSAQGVHRSCSPVEAVPWSQFYTPSTSPADITLDLARVTCGRCIRALLDRARANPDVWMTPVLLDLLMVLAAPAAGAASATPTEQDAAPRWDGPAPGPPGLTAPSPGGPPSTTNAATEPAP